MAGLVASPSPPVHFVTSALMFWGLRFFQVVDAAAQLANPEKGTEEEVTKKTQKSERPPASAAAPSGRCQVKCPGRPPRPGCLPHAGAFRPRFPSRSLCVQLPAGCGSGARVRP